MSLLLLLYLWVSANCQDGPPDIQTLVQKPFISIRILKNEITTWQASALAVEKYLDYDFDFTVTNIVQGLVDLQISTNVTTKIQPTMKQNRNVFSDRVAHFEKLLDRERIALDDLDLVLFYPTIDSLPLEQEALKLTQQPLSDAYNTLKQAEAAVLLKFLIEVKKALLDQVGPLADKLRADVTEVETKVQQFNVIMEAAQVSHDVAQTNMELVLNEILIQLRNKKP